MLGKIVALALGRKGSRLRRLLGSDKLVEINGVAELEAALRRGGVRWVVLDPTALSEPGFAAAIATIAAFGVRVAYYSALQRFDYARLLASLDRLLPVLIFYETDDDCQRLLQVFQGEEEGVPSRVAMRIAAKLQGLRTKLRQRTIGLFAELPIPADVSAFAESAETSESTLREQFRTAGLASPKCVLVAARLSRMYTDLADPDHSLEAIADRHGFGSLRTLERNLRSATGCAPRSATRECGAEEYAKRLAGFSLCEASERNRAY